MNILTLVTEFSTRPPMNILTLVAEFSTRRPPMNTDSSDIVLYDKTTDEYIDTSGRVLYDKTTDEYTDISDRDKADHKRCHGLMQAMEWKWGREAAKITPLKENDGAQAEGCSPISGFFIQSPEAACGVRRKFDFNAEPPWDPS
ncbi:hypothetical protein ElyMa_005125900 [Elysia marginata]|uniref:Uncharacterized protein n=1 Tax=Elysia marginata TaxID=1093978 RepID=A0AAV4JQ91_9GAST|nr:hypothetical protein ElyMa_005125900 [Elysia marginata]